MKTEKKHEKTSTSITLPKWKTHSENAKKCSYMQTSSPRGRVPQAKSGLGGEKEFFTSTSPVKTQPKQITKMIQYFGDLFWYWMVLDHFIKYFLLSNTFFEIQKR